MNRAYLPIAVSAALLVVSATAFANGGARANGTANPSVAAHGQSDLRARSPSMRANSVSSASVQPSARSTSSATTSTADLKSTAAPAEHTTGQPNVECGEEDAPNTPGNAASAPGSAFNPEGRAGEVYAGEQPQNSKNPVSVSQYDAACAHQKH